MNDKRLLLGDEAIALGAIHAGLSGVYAYPGTPSTEITEYIQASPEAVARGIRSRWCTNEKTAMEAALGMSYAGRRALVCMKHVGMNVCADAFVNSAITGVKGGVVVLAADDPSMHSSQNEQDSRFYAAFAMVPVFEPSNQQECYDMMADAFQLSERLAVPVMMRIVTRLAHSRAAVEVRPAREPNPLQPSTDSWVLLPGIARRRYAQLIGKQEAMQEASERSAYNSLEAGCADGVGIVTCGIAHNYVMESLAPQRAKGNATCGVRLLKVSHYPLPAALVRQMAAECRELLVVEDGQPVVEEEVRALVGADYPVRGRLTGHLPRMGELTPDNVAQALERLTPALWKEPRGGQKGASQTATFVPPARPPQMCQGCGHRDVYAALREIIDEMPEARVFGDIGCYTLGALPPYKALSSCVDMGASITMAKGAADAGLRPAIAVIGDSTFTHSGMTGLLDAVNDGSAITVIISDNLTTGMTGGQDSAGLNKYEAICLGLGVDPAHLHVVTPLPRNIPAIAQLLRQEIAYEGVSVIIPRRECIQTARRRTASAPSAQPAVSPMPLTAPVPSLAPEAAARSIDIILCGVGGQGILSIATVIGQAATEAGLHLKQAEVHGMSQRGGDVQSTLRLSTSPIWSDLIPRGRADLVISMEPMESLRYLDYLSPTATVVTSSKPFVNIPDYPDEATLHTALHTLPRVLMQDIEAEAREAGSPRGANMVLLGMAAPYIGVLSVEALRRAIAVVFGRKGQDVVEANLKAFDKGREAVQ